MSEELDKIADFITEVSKTMQSFNELLQSMGSCIQDLQIRVGRLEEESE